MICQTSLRAPNNLGNKKTKTTDVNIARPAHATDAPTMQMTRVYEENDLPCPTEPSTSTHGYVTLIGVYHAP